MPEIRELNNRVFSLLSNYPETRESDDVLFAKYCEYFSNAADLSVHNAFANPEAAGLPNYNSISRARRSVQRAYPNLCSSKKIQQQRKQAQKEMHENYSKEADTYRNIHP